MKGLCREDGKEAELKDDSQRFAGRQNGIRMGGKGVITKTRSRQMAVSFCRSERVGNPWCLQ